MSEQDTYAEQLSIANQGKTNSVPYNSPLDRYGSQISVLTDPSESLGQFELYLRCLKQDKSGNLVKIGSKKIIKYSYYTIIGFNEKLVLRSEDNKFTLEIEKDWQPYIDFIKKNGYIAVEQLDWKPLLNEEGINSIMLLLQSILSPNTALSNLNEWEVGIIIENLGYDLAKLLMFNKYKFELEDVNRYSIVGAALRISYIYLKRPFEEGDKKFFKGITQEITHKQELKKGGGGMSLNPFKWGKQ